MFLVCPWKIFTQPHAASGEAVLKFAGSAATANELAAGAALGGFHCSYKVFRRHWVVCVCVCVNLCTREAS